MLKKILLTLIIFSGVSVFASDNFLNTVILAKEDGQTSVVLRTDEIAKVKKEVVSPDKLILSIKGVTQAQNLTTLYKNVLNVSGLIIQNDGNNELKIYIEAPEISKANIIFETPNAAPVTAINNVNEGRILWCLVSILLLFVVIRSARNISLEEQIDINEVIKEREKALYRSFQKEVATLPSINYKLKGYRKHVLKGETIRSYENRMTKV